MNKHKVVNRFMSALTHWYSLDDISCAASTPLPIAGIDSGYFWSIILTKRYYSCEEKISQGKSLYLYPNNIFHLQEKLNPLQYAASRHQPAAPRKTPGPLKFCVGSSSLPPGIGLGNESVENIRLVAGIIEKFQHIDGRMGRS
ncbi:hypothetical protein IQ266_07170 [filamentous cyanobacterium LEGE 11480]|uniref:Uncharacterized protein n=1 Tax=Romeriopsis navalis LEGE 11480 TaxID=2777977 RepID=A0A928VKR9_9CYAN|nr:hypothetical protein [Romeriopsis navalis]MBE9029543.1 hypothetical protein [Romeriopsis navalis LEGE 11480]